VQCQVEIAVGKLTHQRLRITFSPLLGMLKLAADFAVIPLIRCFDSGLRIAGGAMAVSIFLIRVQFQRTLLYKCTKARKKTLFNCKFVAQSITTHPT
jgi:hypothetical protein